ncbi:MAG: heparan-alpha-glucosaminide N-acetyltransferase [Dehalococcoidia bacterium]
MTQAAASYLSTHRRYWEIDLVRTIALLGLLFFHTRELLYYFDLVVEPLRTGMWFWIRAANCGLFIFPAGMALTISYSRGKSMSGFVRRGLMLFGLGMVLTVLSLLVVPGQYVRFGILHFFGIAFILVPFLIRFRYINLIVGAVVMAIGLYLIVEHIFVDLPWLLWLAPYSFRSLDYWPLVPWFGIFLLGMFFGKILYPEGNRKYSIRELGNPVASAVMLLGRHPLVIYLAHLPIIIGIILVLFPDKILPQIRDALSYLPF